MILQFGKVDKSGGTEPRSPISTTLISLAAFLAGVGLNDAQAQDIAEKAQLCDTCHGEDGKPKEPDTPIIWGQYAGYLYIELRDYKSGLRKNDKMSPIAAELSKDDMMALAQYFSEKKWPQLDTSASNEDALASERMAASGMCKECHLDGYMGASTVPRLSGQSPTYLELTLLAFKTGARANNPAMSALVASYSDDDLKTMARYLGGIHNQ